MFFQFPDVLPIKLASDNQEEPMPVEESPDDQAATPEKVCSHTQLGAMLSQMAVRDLIKQNIQQEKNYVDY